MKKGINAPDGGEKERFDETFNGLSLKGKAVTGRRFYGCVFRGCELTGTIFRSCRFSSCRFESCNLSLARFPLASFSDCSFARCKLTGVNWTEAAWPAVKLPGALNFEDCLLFAAGAAGAQVTLEQAQTSFAGLKAAQADTFAAPAPVRDEAAALQVSMRNLGADPDMDLEKAALMQRLALDHGTHFGGHCYNAVWYDVLVKAGFDDGGRIPGTHAYEFAKYAKENRDWFLNVFKMKIVPTPDSIEEMPAGSVVVYDRGQADPYGAASSESGHIEVIADKDGVRYGCSDACAAIGGLGPFLSDAGAKEHVTVFIPVK
jgi:hypothetical protein